jgi:hypothetical protein
VTGFVSSYEISRIAESAGFDPLAPPLREGTTYVLRATDYRGILMRVVIDARTGAIRDATRIVPGPGRYGQYYGVASPYDPTAFDEPEMEPSLAPPIGLPMEPPSPLRSPPPPPVFAPTHPGASAIVTPPLPRPRPATLSSEISAAAPAPTPSAPSALPAPPSAAPKKPAAVEPLND